MGYLASPTASITMKFLSCCLAAHGTFVDGLPETSNFYCHPFESVVARKRGGGPLLHDLIEQMRGCDTAIIHVTADAAPAGADRQPRIGGDVLIEIGAAMALYGREFVLLIEDGVELPPCLHGLRECRYAGDELNVPAMMRLLCALKSFTQRLSERPLASSDAAFAFRYMQKPDEAAAKH
jgi:Predicted nucleotide-binding protein containing TIR-like domain